MRSRTHIVFMGTPDFAVPPLKALVAAGFNVRRVITQPDRPKGRGKKLAPPPVKQAALELGLPVWQPKSMKDPEVIRGLKADAPDVFVVVAFGHKLTQSLLDIPKVFPINIHASLLPAWRGASPIQAAIRNRDRLSGVTTMVMDEGLDTGDMLLSKTTAIQPDDTAQSLHDRLAPLGGELIVETLDALGENRLTPVPQDHDRATYAPMLTKAQGCVDWNLPAEEISAHVRAMTPWPGAFGFLDGKRIRILEVKTLDMDTSTHSPGTVFSCACDEIRVATGNGGIAILQLQGASGKCLCSGDYLKGNRLQTGECFADFD